MTVMYMIAGVLFVSLLLLWFLHPMVEQDQAPVKEGDYRALSRVLTRIEEEYYAALRKMLVPCGFVIMCKPRLADVVRPANRKGWKNYMGGLMERHVDFLVCNSRLKPLLVIEVDNPSLDAHISLSVDQALLSAGIAVVRFSEADPISQDLLASAIGEYLATADEQKPADEGEPVGVLQAM